MNRLTNNSKKLKNIFMKFTTIKTTSLFILFIATTIISCSSDDSPLTIPQTVTPTDYNVLPLTVGNNWTYDVSTDTGTPPATTSTDVITADGTVMIDSKEYTDMSMSVGSTGTMSTLLDQNNYRSDAGITYMNGDFTFPLSQLGGSDIVILLDDAKMIDQNVAPGTEMSVENGTTNQTVGGIDLDITYTLRTVQQETLANHTVDGQTFDNVVVSDIIIRATATTVGIPLTILPSQDIYVIKNYYADGIGLIDSNATFSYELVDIGQTLPIPLTGSAITTQQITTYTVN